MIRKDGTVKTSQIFKVRAFVSVRSKNDSFGWKQILYKEQVIIAHPKRAAEIYKDFLNAVEVEIYYNSDNKKGAVELFVPHIHENGELAYWPDNNKNIQRFTHNI